MTSSAFLGNYNMPWVEL